MTSGQVIYGCIIESCKWTLLVPTYEEFLSMPLDPAIHQPPAPEFNPDPTDAIMWLVEVQLRHQTAWIDHQLKIHIDSHPIDDWVREVARLREELTHRRAHPEAS